jgi:hypothetical protein
MNLKEMLEAMLLAQYNYNRCDQSELASNAQLYRQARTAYMVACADYVAGLIADGADLSCGSNSENAGASN